MPAAPQVLQGFAEGLRLGGSEGMHETGCLGLRSAVEKEDVVAER